VDRGNELTSFGQAVRAVRESCGMSQEQLAASARLHRTYIGGVERGERNIGLQNIFRIARALGCPASRLIAAAEEGTRR
jgi:transcriptional regulator with XRE-family HTH domain